MLDPVGCATGLPAGVGCRGRRLPRGRDFRTRAAGRAGALRIARSLQAGSKGSATPRHLAVHHDRGSRRHRHRQAGSASLARPGGHSVRLLPVRPNHGHRRAAREGTGAPRHRYRPGFVGEHLPPPSSRRLANRQLPRRRADHGPDVASSARSIIRLETNHSGILNFLCGVYGRIFRKLDSRCACFVVFVGNQPIVGRRFWNIEHELVMANMAREGFYESCPVSFTSMSHLFRDTHANFNDPLSLDIPSEPHYIWMKASNLALFHRPIFYIALS
jgi:hypothetical protein